MTNLKQSLSFTLKPGSVQLAQIVEAKLEAGVVAIAVELVIPENTAATVVDNTDLLGLSACDVTVRLAAHSAVQYELHVVDTPRKQLADAAVVSTVESTASHVSKTLKFRMEGEGAQAKVQCTYLAGNKRSFKLVTVQEHVAKRTTSDLIVKGVFEGEAQFFCDSLIYVHEGASQTDANQVNKNLLLSKTARAISIPKLEVLTNDVACRHGSATSRISDDDLFYLQSRGISDAFAREMLINAFLS